MRSCTDGLGEKLGGVLFDFGPYPSSQMKTLQGRQKAVEELGAFAEGLVRELGSADAAPVLAFEVRNPTLLTPRLMALLRNFGIRPVMGLNEGMPGLQRQMRALAACDAQDPSDPDWRLSGPLFVRWHRSGPLSPVFVRDPESKSAGDPVTRTLIASLVMRAVRRLRAGGRRCRRRCAAHASGHPGLARRHARRRAQALTSYQRESGWRSSLPMPMS